jgi:hypothetical protein
MDIHIEAGRDVKNHWVEVTVKGGGERQVAMVATVLDGFSIGSDDVVPPEDSYRRAWSQVGTGAPNQTHEVVVTAVDDKGNQSSASKTWQD